MKASLKFVPALMIAVVATSAISAKTDTTRKNLSEKPQAELIERIAGKDTGTYSDSIILSGYDKTLTGRDETFYVTNRTPFRISRLVIKFSYTDSYGNMLHEEEYDIDCDIPAASTRQIAVKSWDKQHNHYYYKSRKPRRSAVPFHVKYTLLRYDVAITVE